MRLANIKVKDLYKFLDRTAKIHLVVIDNDYYPDYIGKFSELCKYRLYDSIYDAVVDRIFYLVEDTECLNVYVSLRE